MISPVVDHCLTSCVDAETSVIPEHGRQAQQGSRSLDDETANPLEGQRSLERGPVEHGIYHNGWDSRLPTSTMGSNVLEPEAQRHSVGMATSGTSSGPDARLVKLCPALLLPTQADLHRTGH